MKRLIPILTLGLVLAARLVAGPLTVSTYAYVDGGVPYGLQDSGGELTNGLYGAMIPGLSLASPPNEWVEFGGGGKIKFSFATNVTVNQIVMSMARWEPAAIYLPDVLKINDVDYSGYAGAFNDMDRAFVTLNGSWTGTDLTIYFSHSQYLFMDEVSFSGQATGESVPDAGSALWLLLPALTCLFIATNRGLPRTAAPARRST